MCVAFPIRLLALSKLDVCNYPRILLPVKPITEGRPGIFPFQGAEFNY
jgi:hypothetical protein